MFVSPTLGCLRDRFQSELDGKRYALHTLAYADSTLLRLAAFVPRTLALMYGSSLLKRRGSLTFWINAKVLEAWIDTHITEDIF